MTKQLLTALLIAGSASGIFAAAHAEKADFTDFKREGIAIRNTVTPLPGERVTPNSFKAPEKKVDKGHFAVKLNSPFKNADRFTQQMDSVVRKTILGENISRQIFTYTSTGQYLRSDNYIFENGMWVLYNFYNYEYDDFGRLTMREQINPDFPYENMRYEYFYNNDTDLYTTEILYVVMDYETGELVPFQKGDYVYDETGNPIEQTFFNWNNEDGTWLLAGRETVSFDELGRQTSYFKYVANETGTELIGDTGESYIYVGNTNTDAEVDYYIWENDEWLKYQRHVYTYENNLLMKNEFIFWNRAKQDWSGGDAYGPWGYVENNFYTDYTYDSLGRIVEALAYLCNKDGEYVNDAVDAYSYTDLEDGNVERIYIQSFMWEGPYISPFKKDIQRFNPFGAETYYKHFAYMSGEERATTEEIRVIDANNMYHEGWFYGFTNDEANTRYGQSREEFGYPEDWDGVSDTPSYGMHWKGTGYDTDTTWVEYNKDEFVWHDELMIGCTSTVWNEGESCVQTKWFNNFDFNVPASNILKWYVNIRGEDEYKLLADTNYYDSNLDGEWDTTGYYASYSDTFFYSDIINTGITDIETNGNVIEIERYDLSGRRLEAPVNGINIVKYSDGSVRKLMVR